MTATTQPSVLRAAHIAARPHAPTRGPGRERVGAALGRARERTSVRRRGPARVDVLAGGT